MQNSSSSTSKIDKSKVCKIQLRKKTAAIPSEALKESTSKLGSPRQMRNINVSGRKPVAEEEEKK